VWKRHIVDSSFEGADVYTGDINGDNQSDFVVAGYNMGMGVQPDSVTWFEFTRNNGDVTWEKHIVDKDIVAPGDISLNDMNGDGKLDIVTISYKEGHVLWYENN